MRCTRVTRSTRATPATRLVALAAAAVLPLVLAGAAVADTTSVPGVLTTSSTPGEPGTADTLGSSGAVSGPTLSLQAGPIDVPVPPGVTPSAITGVLTMPAVVDGATIVVLVNGAQARRVPAALYSRIQVPVTPADVVADGTIALSLRYDAPAGSTSCSPAPGVTVRKLGLTYTGTETPPTSVSGFFPAAVPRVDVRVAADAEDDVLQAALNAVAALSQRYQGGDTPVELSTDDEPLTDAGAGQRVVSVVGSDGDVTASVDTTGPVPTLELSGAGLPLSAAARGLGGDELVLAGGQETQGLTRQVESRAGGATRSFDQLRTDAASPVGVVQPDPAGSSTLEIRQDSFGGTVEGYDVHLEGTHTAVPADAEARLDVYLDDELVGSQQLGDDDRIDLDVTVPPEALRSTNRLRATLVSADDPAALCPAGLPLGLSIDGEASTVTADPGNGEASGFVLFPQSLVGRISVALVQEGEARAQDAIDAAALITSMQRVGAAPFDVTVVDPDLFLTGEESGIVVGAGTEEALALGAPLQLSANRSLDVADTAFAVTTTEPFAALQALAQRGRYVLLLGSWQAGGVQADPELSHRLTGEVVGKGWDSLEGDIVVADEGEAPYSLDSGTPTTEPVADEEGETSYVGWFVAGIALLLGLLALQFVRAVRRDRRAQEAREATEDPGEPVEPGETVSPGPAEQP